MSCSGPCEQGRRKCPTPEACFNPEEATPPRIYGRLISLLFIGTLALLISALL